MKRGWILDPYLRGKDAHLWIKTVEGEAIHLTDRHRPHFIAQPAQGFHVDDLCFLLEEHKLVHSAKPVDRYPDLRRAQLEKVVEARVDSAQCLDKVVSYARGLKEVREVFDVGLSSIQWYLIEKGVAPTGLCEFEAVEGRLQSISAIEETGVEPPPFKIIMLRLPEDGAVKSVEALDAD